MPRVGEYEVVGADQPQATVWQWFVNDDLRFCRIENAVTTSDMFTGYIPWRPSGAADAAEQQAIALCFGHGNLAEALGQIADQFDESAGVILLIGRSGVVLRCRIVCSCIQH